LEPNVTITSILLIVLLVVPGVFFKRFYFQGSFSKQFGFGLFADRLITSIFWGILIQILTFIIFSRVFDFTYENVKKPIADFYLKLLEKKIPELTIYNLKYLFGYLLSSVFVGSILGWLFHSLVRLLKIDIKFPVFRFANQWHYYFKGEILQSTDFKRYNEGKWLSTTVDALIENGDGTNKLISGFLTQYMLSSKSGELETIYLTEARRFSKSKNEFVEIPGHCLIIPYSKVIDLNVRYNIKLDNQNKKGIFSKFIFPILSFVLLIYSIVLPFLLELSTFKQVSGVLLSLMDWLFLIAIISSPMNPNPKERLNRKAMLTSIFLFLALLISILFLYRVF
jgi:hypothetical protein